MSKIYKSHRRVFTFEPLGFNQNKPHLNQRKNSVAKIDTKLQRPNTVNIRRNQSSLNISHDGDTKMKNSYEKLAHYSSYRKLPVTKSHMANLSPLYKSDKERRPIIIEKREIPRYSRMPMIRNSLRTAFGIHDNAEISDSETTKVKRYIEMLKVVIQSPKVEKQEDSFSDEDIYSPKYVH